MPGATTSSSAASGPRAESCRPCARGAGRGSSVTAALRLRGGRSSWSPARTDDGGVAEMTDTRERLRRVLIRAMSHTHGRIYRTSGGRLLGRVAGMPVLLLTTTGRGSGRPRTATLTYFRRRRPRRDRLLRRLRPAARLVAQPPARSPGERADWWDDLEGDGEGGYCRGARPAVAARDRDQPGVRPLPEAHRPTDPDRVADAGEGVISMKWERKPDDPSSLPPCSGAPSQQFPLARCQSREH